MMGAQGLCSCLEKIQKKKSWNNSLWTPTSQDSLAKSEEQPDCDHFSYKCFITDYHLTDGSLSRFSEAVTQHPFPGISHTWESSWDR